MNVLYNTKTDASLLHFPQFLAKPEAHFFFMENEESGL